MTTTQQTGLLDILVVEDSPTQAQHLARLLSADPSCRVRIACDGNAALFAMRSRLPDLVISDVAMPGMDGFTLCRKLKADPAMAAIPVLLLTQLASMPDMVRALEVGADAFVPKPYDPDVLLARAYSLVRRADGATEPLGLMAPERQQIYAMLVATHEQALRLNADLAAQRTELERGYASLQRVGKLAAALNEALSEQAVAEAVIEHLPRLAPLAGAALSSVGPDGVLRALGTRGAAGACAECLDAPPVSGPAVHGERLCLPLMANGERSGVLHLVPSTGELNSEARGLIGGVTEQVALALGRARLYARMEGQVAERTAALCSERNRLSAVVDTAGALVLLAAPDGRIVMFNRACETALGWPAEDVVGVPCWNVLRPCEDEDQVRRLFEALAQDPSRIQPKQRLEGEWHTRDGRSRSIIWTVTVLRGVDGGVEYVLGTGIDATELRGAEERLRYLSNFDTLTGLPNRILLRESLRDMKAAARADGGLLGLMLVRMTRMPLIREGLGPAAEQIVLQQAATRIRDLAGADTAGRFSEDTFAMAVLRSDAAALAQAARRMLAILGAPYVHEGEELHLEPCIGIAVYPNDGLSYDALAKGAETALRLATDSASQRYVFYRPELNRGANDRFKLEAALRRAIERDELEVHFQPQFRVDDGTIVGAEALLRWRHPERGMVSPAVFIPLAEECGLILPIGEWVLRSVSAQLREWVRVGLSPVPVAVNLSAHQFTAPVVACVQRILDEYGVDPRLLELELTETASMADPDKTCELLLQLKAMGIALSIDDFGTGYSNLNYLKRFPVDKLKLDQSFVRDILADPDDLAISRAVIALGHGLHLTVVAEGVETPGQLAALAELGCDLAQGYHFSPAVPAAEFAQLLQNCRERVPSQT